MKRTRRPAGRVLFHALTSVLIAALALLAAPPPARAAGGDEAGADEVVVLETTLGTMTIRLFPDEAPRTVANFKRLVSEGFYDGLPFYRVVAGHVIQAGDGGENDQPTVPLEAGGHPHVEGAVGLARDVDPDSGSTEFYICLADRPHLDGKYAVFGQLADGYDVLRRIGAVEVTEQWVGDEGTIAFHEPKEPVVIRRAWLRRSGEPGEPPAETPGEEPGDAPAPAQGQQP